MKKIITAAVLFAAITVQAELGVPQGAQIQVPVQSVQSVAVSKIAVTELRCVLATNATSSTVYFISLNISDSAGKEHKQVMRMTDEQASAVMGSTGFSLSNIVSSATAAIQAVVNQRFGAGQ